MPSMLLKMDSHRVRSPGISVMTASTCSEAVILLLLSTGCFLSSARSDRPPTRTMRNSSRLDSKIDTNFRRSNSGTVSSKASSSTRLSKRSQLSSRFCVYEKSRGGLRSFAAACFFSILLGICICPFSPRRGRLPNTIHYCLNLVDLWHGRIVRTVS